MTRDRDDFADEPRVAGCRHAMREANGIRFHVVEAGDGPPLLLLHGFPEFWWSWRKVIPELAQHFRLVMPDLRGFNLTDKPPEGYDLDTLADDVAGLLAACAIDRPVPIIGHDWGGVVAYRLAMRHPDRVARLLQLNAPHPNAWARGLLSHPVQQQKGWYVFLTLAPDGVSEDIYRRQFAEGTIRIARVSSPEEVAVYAAAFNRPGAATAAVNYYRAFMQRIAVLAREEPPTIAAPVTVLWGERDVALEPVLNDIARPWIEQMEVVYFSDAYHWLALERPKDVVSHARRLFAV